MSLVQRHNLAVFLTVGLGILLYSAADGSLGLGLFAMTAWAASWPLAQGPNGMTLPRPVVTALVLAATAQTLLSIMATPTDLIISISRYLVWLHLIKLYDRTGPRDKGQLLMMSIFLVLGAMLTSNHLIVGLLLLAYLPALLYTAMLHQMTLGERELAEERERLRPQDRRRFVRNEPSGRTRSRDFGFVAACSGVLIALFAAMIFVTAPRRVGAGVVAEMQAPTVGNVTGFRDEVQLGSQGLINESAVQVFELELANGEGENIGPELEGVLVRGAVLDEYSDGEWRRSEASSQLERRNDTTLPNAQMNLAREPGIDDEQILRQRYKFRNKQIGSLFSIYRPVSFQYDDVARFSFSFIDQTMRLDEGGRLEYTVESVPDAPLPDWLADRIPRLPPLFREGAIHDFANRILEREGLSRDPAQRYTEDDPQIARAFERFLQNNFQYTTRMIAPEAGEEPIEMFLFRRREGHCEYFASGMAALCRSVGMDARVVTGYVAAEYEPGRGVFTVRESNAHAWTEVAVASGDWRTYDPSPPSDVSAEHRPPGGIVGLMRSTYESLERLWVNEVVSYEEGVASQLLAGQETSALASLGERLRRTFGPDAAGALPQRILRALLGGLGVFGVTAIVGLAGVRLVRLLRSRLIAWRERRRLVETNPALFARQQQTAFVRELLARLERNVRARAAGESPRAYLRSVAGEDGALREAAERLAALYYACRFGGRFLSEGEQADAQRMGRHFVDTVVDRRRATGASSG